MSSEPFVSQALRVNLERTRRALDGVELPAEHQWLLTQSQGKPGIHGRTASCLWELRHPLPDLAYVGTELRAIALGDFWFYLECSDPPRAMAALGGAFADLLALGPPADVRERACHSLLELVALLLQAPAAERFEPTVAACVLALDRAVRVDPQSLAHASGYLKTLAAPLAVHPRFGAAVRALLSDALRTNVELWRSTLGLEHWHATRRAVLDEDQTARVAALGEAHWARLERQRAAAGSWSELCALDDFHRVADQVRSLFDDARSARDRARYLLYAIRLPAMNELQELLLWDLQRTCRSLGTRDDGGALDELVRAVCDELRSYGPRHRRAVLGCLSSLGQAVYATGQRELVERFQEQVVSFGFVSPRPVDSREHHELGWNANHVQNVRVWLELIALRPAWSTTLLSTLTASLATRGVFIADTDLFQRDVSRLLNSPIVPVYRQITQLCRFFPVFFHEVGAEGALRDVTTRVDELTHRGDALIHFMRQQIHSESNSTHVALCRAVLAYWAERAPERLAPHLPEELLRKVEPTGQWIDGVHEVVASCTASLGCSADALLDVPWAELEPLLSSLTAGTPLDRERVGCLVRIHALLVQKYSLAADGTLPHMDRLARISDLVKPTEVTGLEQMLAQGELDAALSLVYRLMARMRAVILDPQATTAQEDIFYKRHIAAGIPSMYGRYFEPKCAALGLSYRLESLASQLLAELVRRVEHSPLSRHCLRQVAHLLQRFREGLELAGIENEGLRSHLGMLEASLGTSSFSLAQFVDLFQFLTHSVREIMHEHFLGHHEHTLPETLRQWLCDVAEGPLDARELEQTIHARSEEFYRELLARAFLVGPLDSFVTAMLTRLNELAARVPPAMVQRLMSFEPDLAFTAIGEPKPEVESPVFLGAKGYFLKKLRAFGYPVPPGFILTTEVFRIRDVFPFYPELQQQMHALVDEGVRALEQATGRRLGDPDDPLLLSVRSGAAMSMPGAMSTFLNVGLNAELVERWSQRPNYGWTSWDCYRRSLQMWGMAHGLARDDFDRIIMDFKQRCGVREKVQFRPEQMRDIALAYRDRLAQSGIELEPELRAQLITAIRFVLDSWDAPRARIYREQLRIADEWGTAVIVQHMVLGNIGYDSGTGVTFTADPYSREPGVSLYGDFTTTSQGEDVVGGLVHPWPVSRRQLERTGATEGHCLEERFPEIHGELQRLANDLVHERGFGPQEMEFTFESGRKEDLYLLQTRSHRTRSSSALPVFDLPPGATPLARGMGIGGGAMNGLVAFDDGDLARLAEQHPGVPRVLVRSDTVPDDIGMIFQCDGLLTARGGATSHAGVTASRLGKTCVVNCRALQVDEAAKVCRVHDQEFRSGDLIAIDGRQGDIYVGHHKIVTTRIVHC